MLRRWYWICVPGQADPLRRIAIADDAISSPIVERSFVVSGAMILIYLGFMCVGVLSSPSLKDLQRLVQGVFFGAARSVVGKN